MSDRTTKNRKTLIPKAFRFLYVTRFELATFWSVAVRNAFYNVKKCWIYALFDGVMLLYQTTFCWNKPQINPNGISVKLNVPYVIIILSFLCLMDCSALYALVVGVAELKNTLPRIAVIAFLREGFFCGVKWLPWSKCAYACLCSNTCSSVSAAFLSRSCNACA